jgi:uncharacterized protein YjiS (DUF1127 family)
MSCIQREFHPVHSYWRPPAAPCDTARLRAEVLRHILGTISAWFARRSQRRDLAALDDAQLKDIGVTRGAAQREAAKPFWIE